MAGLFSECIFGKYTYLAASSISRSVHFIQNVHGISRLVPSAIWKILILDLVWMDYLADIIDIHVDYTDCLDTSTFVRYNSVQTIWIEYFNTVNMRFKTTALRDWPLIRDHFSGNLDLHFYTLIHLMKDHLSYKTTFVVPWVVINHRFHCYSNSMCKRSYLSLYFDNYTHHSSDLYAHMNYTIRRKVARSHRLYY